MLVTCEDIPNTEDVKKALYGKVRSMVRVRYIGEREIPGIDATKLVPCIFPEYYKKVADKIESFKVYEDDVWVTSFPKCGTTWTQEMVWLIRNDLDFDGAKKSYLTERYGFLERSGILHDFSEGSNKTSVELCQSMCRPRFIKTHLPISLLPTEFWTTKPKLVYVTRNPKDAAISFYHHYVNLNYYKRNLDDFLNTFLNDLTVWSPFKDHVLGYWQLRNEPNILFIRYEDLIIDLKSVLRNIAKFFDKTYTDDQFNQLANHLSFDEMKKNWALNNEHVLNGRANQYAEKRPDSNYQFLRRGQLNSAKDEMPFEFQKKFDDWLAKAFTGSNFKFNI